MLAAQVKDLHVSFPIYAGIFRTKVGSVDAVRGVSFNVDRGEVVSLVGESGSGKSTVARAMMGLEAYEGVIEVADCQMVFQDPFASLNPRRSIEQSVSEGLTYHGIPLEDIEGLMAQVGLSKDTLRRYPHQLSGGQQQRVCIARAIAMRPKLIIFDEAIAKLDVSVQAQILNLMMHLRKKYGLAYLFISHDLSVVKHISDRVLVMDKGKIVEEKPTELLFEAPEHPYTKQLLEAIL